MIRTISLIVIFGFLMLSACGSHSEDDTAVTVQNENSSVVTGSDDSDTSDSSAMPEITSAGQHEEMTDHMQITAGEKQFDITAENSDTVRALTGILPITLDMSELNGNEKYCYIDTPLPSAPEKAGHINEGDIMLYGDSCIVVFYKSFDTSYSYTKIGHIADVSGLSEALGTGSVTVTFEMKGSSETE